MVCDHPVLMLLTECLLHQVFQSISHIGWTRRTILHSRHNLFLDGVDDKQEPVWREKTFDFYLNVGTCAHSTIIV